MGKNKNRLYRFIDRTNAGRNIEVIFHHIPGKRISTGTKDMTEAILFAERFLEHDGLGKEKKKDITLGEFCKDFFSRRDSNSLFYRYKRLKKVRDEIWWKNSQAYVDNYIQKGLGWRRLDALTARGIENWLIDVKGVDGQEIAPATKAKILQCLRTILDEAVRDELIPDNAALKASAPYNDPSERGERRVFSLYEQKLLMPESDEERVELWGSLMWATYFSVLADTGMRSGEAMGLRVCDVYKTAQGYGVMAVQEVSADGKSIKKRVKTSGKGFEKRVGLLSSVTGLLIERLITEEEIEDHEECLFLIKRKEKDSYICANTANKHLRGVLKRLQLEDATQYSFRHTFATYRRGGTDETALALAMGHTGGRVRDDYDHRTASILIGQLEKHRDSLFTREEEKATAIPLKTKKAK